MKLFVDILRKNESAKVLIGFLKMGERVVKPLRLFYRKKLRWVEMLYIPNPGMKPLMELPVQQMKL
jgi:hypothetical protein